MTEHQGMAAVLEAQDKCAKLIRRHDLWTAFLQYCGPYKGFPQVTVNARVEPRPTAFMKWLTVLSVDQVNVRKDECYTDLYARVLRDGVWWLPSGALPLPSGPAAQHLPGAHVEWFPTHRDGADGVIPVADLAAVIDAYTADPW